MSRWFLTTLPRTTLKLSLHAGPAYVSRRALLSLHPTQTTRYHNFQTSTAKQALPPIIFMVLRPVIKVSAMVFGRTIRKRWQKLPPVERARISAKFKKKLTPIAAVFTFILGTGFLYYVEHIEEEPLTKRKRFILYTEEQMKLIGELEFDNTIMQYKPEIVPPSHPIYKRVVRVANQLLQSNNHLSQVQGKNWAVTVVDRPDIINAFVLNHGKIVIFTGILNVANNDHQLAIVLSHEIAHALLQHMTENLSKTFLVEMILIIPVVLLWALLPDAAALFSQWCTSRLADIMVLLPFSRAFEKEADVVGLELAARACYDIREAPVFWGKMSQVQEKEPLEWLSTHPHNETRQAELSHLIPAALNIRSSCACPRLPPKTATQMYYTKQSLPQLS